MSDAPSPTEDSGRLPNGRFGKGNRAGKGNPMNARTQKIRAVLLESATIDDVEAICRKLVDGAKAGDLAFIREWMDRCIGRPAQEDLLKRVEAIEALIDERLGQ